MQDMVQPYRGRDENLFAFFVYMFLIVLVHTSTMVSNGDKTALIINSFVLFLCVLFFVGSMATPKIIAKQLAKSLDQSPKERANPGYIAVDTAKGPGAAAAAAEQDNTEPEPGSSKLPKRSNSRTSGPPEIPEVPAEVDKLNPNEDVRV